MDDPSTSISSDELAVARAKFDSLPPVIRNMFNPETITVTGGPYSSAYAPLLPNTTTVWMKRSGSAKYMHAVLRMLLPDAEIPPPSGGVLYLKISRGKGLRGRIIAAGARVDLDLLVEELGKLHSGTYRKYQQPGDRL